MTISETKCINWGLSDKCDYDQIIDIYQNKTGPLFLFNVTMQNHGGFDLTLAEGTDYVQIDGQYAENQELINYLTLIKESDVAFENLIEYFSNVDEPTIICMFGDHQPQLEGWDNIVSNLNLELIQDVEKQYVTPYIIWANYDTGFSQINKDMSTNYLGANLLQIAGISTAYQQYLLNLENYIPIINSIGYMDNTDTWDAISMDNSYINEYSCIQYYQMMAIK